MVPFLIGQFISNAIDLSAVVVYIVPDLCTIVVSSRHALLHDVAPNFPSGNK